MILIGHEIMIELIARSTDNLYGAVTFDALLYGTYRGYRGRTSNVTCTIISIDHVQRAFTYLLLQLLTLREVLVFPTLCVSEAVSHHDAAAINTLPQADGIWITLITAIEGFRAPSQFL